MWRTRLRAGGDSHPEVGVVHAAIPFIETTLTFAQDLGSVAGLAVAPHWGTPLPAVITPDVLHQHKASVREFRTAPRQITATLLRTIPLGSIENFARAELRRVSAYPGLMTAQLKGTLDSWRETPRPGRAGRGDADYAQMAAHYVDLLRHGDPKPATTLAKRHHYEVSHVKNVLYEARRRGLLTAAPRGKPGGDLTKKAIEILKRTQEDTE